MFARFHTMRSRRSLCSSWMLILTSLLESFRFVHFVCRGCEGCIWQRLDLSSHVPDVLCLGGIWIAGHVCVVCSKQAWMPWDTCSEIACPACSTATLVVLNLEPLHSFCSSNSRYSCTLTICVLFELRLKLGFCCSWVFGMPLYWPSEEEGFRCTVFSYCLSVYLSGYYIDQVLKFGFVSKSSFDSSLLVPPWIFAFASQDNIPSLKLKTWLDLRWRSCCHFYIGSFAWVASRKSNCCPSSPTLQMTSDFDTLVPECLQLWCFLRFYQRFCLLCWYCFCY